MILIDSGYLQCLYLTIENIRALGLDPYRITHTLHSHGHYDYIGGTRALVELTDAKTIISRADRDYVNGKLDLSWAKELGYKYDEVFEPDILFDDGDIIEIGKTKIRAVSTPGHTPGTMSFFFNVSDEKDNYTVAMFGGLGLNSMKLSFLDSYGLPHSMRDVFPDSLKKVYHENVDIVIGNHPHNVDTKGKYEALMRGEKNPFIDKNSWKKLLDDAGARFDDMIKNGL